MLADQTHSARFQLFIDLLGHSAHPPGLKQERHQTQGASYIASFRYATTQRHYDQNTQKWVDGDTNWYTITAFRHLAIGVYNSINKGDRVIVTGRLRIRDWESSDKTGTNIDVEADTIGHDLNWGTSTFTRTPHKAAADEIPGQDTETTSPAPEPEA